MVGPGEVDEELQPEVVEECAKYGEVVKVIIYEVIVVLSRDQLLILLTVAIHCQRDG